MTDSTGSGEIRSELRVGDEVPAPPSSVAATRGSSPSSSLNDADPAASCLDDEVSRTERDQEEAVEEDPGNQAALVERIVALGFDRQLVAAAVQHTRGEGGVEAALALILDQSEDPGWEDVTEIPALMTNAMTACFKMVFVVNAGLKMGLGKTAAQVGHATLSLYRAIAGNETGRQALAQWNENGETKVVVKTETDEELMAIYATAKQRGLPCYLVQDAGRTQIAAGSRTVLSLFGPVETIDAITGHLKLI